MYFVLDRNKDCIPPNCTSISLNDSSKLNFLCTFLQSNTTVKKINLSRIHIGDEGAKAIAEALKVNQTITKLDLDDTEIGLEGVKAIAEALKVNCTVRKLYLSGKFDFGYQVGDEGAKAIAEALKVNCTIKKLYLWDNGIGDEGANAIAEALKINCTITLLNLWRNEIGDEGAKAIAEALKVNCTVIQLVLCMNQIGGEGAKAIAEALKVNCTVAHLDLYDCNDAAEKEIYKALQVNNFIHNNFIYEEVADTWCKKILGLSLQVPIYVLLDIYELGVISDLERKTNSHKFYNNTCFSKLLEKKVSKKRLVCMMDKMNRHLILNSNGGRKRKNLDECDDLDEQQQKITRKN